MSGFVERLVARGAGVGDVSGFAALKPRPLSRFEAAPNAAEGLESAEPADRPWPLTNAEDPSRVMPAATIATPPGRPDPGSRPVFESRASLVMAPVAAGRATIDRARAEEAHVATQIRAAGPRSDAASDKPARSQLSAASQRDAPAPPPPREVTEAASQRPPALQRDWPTTTERSPAIHAPEVVALRATQPAGPPPQVTVAERRPAGQMMTAEDDRAPPVTVTVGRIDVQFVQPSPPAAAAPQAPRTRGFDAYARARRGQPR
jgi:hypothetical protein